MRERISPGTTPTDGWSIGEVSQQTGLPIDTLRFYDRSGLLGDLPRTAGGRRIFDQAALGLLDVVVRLRRTGMPIDEVRAFVDRVRADADRAGRIELLQVHRQRVSRQIEQLQADLAVIDWKIAAYSAAANGRPGPPPPAGWPDPGDLLPLADRFDIEPNESTFSQEGHA
jgi:DNA-binding transcriptional MerR regulator